MRSFVVTRLAPWAVPAVMLVLACNSSTPTYVPPASDAGTDAGAEASVPPLVDAGADVVVPSGPPTAVLSATDVTFGNIDCGSAAPADQTFTIQNTGGGRLTWSVQIDNASYFDISSAKSGTLAANETATVTVKASSMPASANAGDLRQATLAVTTSDPLNPFKYVPIKATAQGATLTVTPANVTFGDVPIQTNAPEIALNIKNTGNAPALIAFAQPANTDFTVAVGGSTVTPQATVAPGATSTGVTARFHPSTINLASTSSAITVTGAVCGQSATTIAMNGRGAGGVVGVSPGALDYGLVNCGTTTGAQVITVFNTGSASYTYTASLTAGAASPFTISPATSTVLAGSQSSIIVTPKAIPQTSPTTANGFGDTLNITTSSAGDTPHAVALTQTASGAILALSATPLAFGTQTAFVPSAPQSFDVINTGNAAANVTVVSSNPDFAGPAGAASVPAGGALARGVTVAPSQLKAVTGTLSVTSSTTLCAPLPGGLAATAAGIAKAVQISAATPNTRNRNAQLATRSSCALIQGGRVVCWDNGGEPAILSNLTDAVSVANSGEFGCAAKADGTVACWGLMGSSNNNSGFNKSYGATPVQVPVLTTAIAVGAAHKHACALTTAGTVYCWGVNAHGQLGNGAPGGHASDTVSPVQVSGITTATQISVMTMGGCALLADGSTQCWGGNGGRWLNFGNTPQNVNAGAAVTKVAAGGTNVRSGFICARQSDSTVNCWGDGSHAKLGNDSCTNRGQCGTGAPGASVSNVTTATDVSVGAYGGCVLLADGTVQCWGRNSQGEVGTGTDGEHGLPTTVPGVTNATAISAGATGTCAIIAGGSVQCWGFGGAPAAKVTGF
jgi:hypothetical protein